MTKTCLLLIFTLLFTLTCTTSFAKESADKGVQKIIASWRGAPIEEVIEQWGFPSDEKVILNHRYIIWRWATGDNNVDAVVPGSTASFCDKTFEIDKANMIIDGEWHGSFCEVDFATWGRKKPKPSASN